MNAVLDKPYLDVPIAPLAKCVADGHMIVELVATAYRIEAQTVVFGGREKLVMEARKVAYWLLRTVAKRSWGEVASTLSKDHSTAISGVRGCESKRANDPAFREFTDQLAIVVAQRIQG